MATYLQQECARASFNMEAMTHFLYGSKQEYELHKKWMKLFDDHPLFDTMDDHFLSRDELMRKAMLRAMESYKIMKQNKDLLAQHSPLHGEGGKPITRYSGNHSGITDHYALFVSTIMAQGTPEQVREWVPRGVNCEIIGTYAQTELGHGTNVRGLETVAVFDQSSDSFVIDMPTITAMKWWPGALGVMATHAIVYARLIVAGKDLGFHAFVVQVRDADLKPLPGVEVGDLGPKLGGNAMDSGYLRLTKVRVPRFNMLAKFQQLAADGSYTAPPKQLAKIAYATMMKTRVIISLSAAYNLLKNCTIGLRYNAFRKQGFKDAKSGISAGEVTILDYRIQQFRIFPQLAAGFGLMFVGQQLLDMLSQFEGAVKKAGKNINSIDTTILPALHATSAGVKSFSTEMAAYGIEEVRRCCGGQGFAHSSGISSNLVDYLPAVTYEGDRTPMALQTARAIVGVLAGKLKVTGTESPFAYLKSADNTSLSKTDDLAHLLAVWETASRNAAMIAGKELMKANAAGMKNDQAWNACHVELIACAYAHTVTFIVRSFVQGVKRAPADAQPALSRLCQLFALTRLTLLPVQHSRLTPKQGIMIDNAVKDLLTALRPDIVPLAESFQWSDRILHSCIARSDGKIYEAVYEWAKRSPLNKREFIDGVQRDILAPYLNREYLAKGNNARGKL